MLAVKRRIKGEADVFQAFPRDVRELPGGENLDKCIQCGTCSGSCPLSIYMDHTPRRIIALTKAGLKQEVLESLTIWLCASCYACTVECPKEIDITDIMYGLKQRAMREHAYPKYFPIPVLAREFFRMVRKNGRVTENRLVLSLFCRTQITKLLGQVGLGLKLLRRGRIPWNPLATEKMARPQALRDLLDAASKNGKGAGR